MPGPSLHPLRLVLSSVSDYFAAMFTSDVREAKQDEVKMEGVDPDALWVLVQYAYTGMHTQMLEPINTDHLILDTVKNIPSSFRLPACRSQGGWI